MQEAAVALIVLAALVFAVWHFMPARWRRRAAARLGLGARAANAGSCQACDECGACPPASRTPPGDPAASKREGQRRDF